MNIRLDIPLDPLDGRGVPDAAVGAARGGDIPSVAVRSLENVDAAAGQPLMKVSTVLHNIDIVSPSERAEIKKLGKKCDDFTAKVGKLLRIIGLNKTLKASNLQAQQDLKKVSGEGRNLKDAIGNVIIDIQRDKDAIGGKKLWAFLAVVLLVAALAIIFFFVAKGNKFDYLAALKDSRFIGAAAAGVALGALSYGAVWYKVGKEAAPKEQALRELDQYYKKVDAQIKSLKEEANKQR